MKRIPLLLFYLFFFSQIVGQNCQENYKYDNRYKEIYDYLAAHKYTYTFPIPNDDLNGDYSSFTYPFNNYTYPNNANDAVREFGNLESVGNILESLIRMYEITHDKAYLIKAINKSIQLMNARGGATAPSPYAWASGRTNTSVGASNYVPNVPGNILHPMAHLCHLILIDEHSTLCPEVLPLSPVNLIPNLPSLPQNTYGEFADWLVHRCVESLDWCINNFWISDTEGFRDEHTGDYGGAINQQAPYAAALFYLGHLTNITPCFAYQGYYSGLQSYMDKASNLAYLYNGSVKLYKDDNNCSSSTNNCFDLPVFRYIGLTDSYWWYSNGWGFQKNQIQYPPFWSCIQEYRVKCTYYEDITPDPHIENGTIKFRDYRSIEDISHGIRTLIYPRILNKYNATSGGNLMFDDAKMLRFRNVIKNVAWNQDSNNPLFYSTVSGAGYDGSASSSTCPMLPCPMDELKWGVLNWMSFAEYELPGSELYNILVNKLIKIYAKIYKYNIDIFSFYNV